MRKAVAVLCGTGLLLASGSALAQDFGAKGDMVFGADRLFAIHATHRNIDLPNGDSNVDFTGFSFAWNGPAQPSPFTVPRFGFDYFIIDRLSIGGSLDYSSISASNDNDKNNNDVQYSSFLIAPRVGYVWMFSNVFGFWLRGGFTYHSYSVDGPGDEHGLAFTAEPTFVWQPVPHFGFEFGPALDIDFTGSKEYGNPIGDRDLHYRTISLQVGVMGWL